MRGYPTNDGGRAAEVTLENVKAIAMLGAEGKAYPVLEEVMDRAAAAICAESLGLMAVLNDMTTDYAKTREQFGQAIGKFQILQHRMVDMFVALEESRSLTAVYMADAYAQLTGQVGVAMITAAPGFASGLGPLYTSHMAESPILL